MSRKARPLAIRAILITALGLSLLTVPAVTPTASATNPDCAPTAFGPSTSDRGYLFTSTTLCDWVVPVGFTSFSVLIFGGGGGGGGGSWSGTTGGGGGGGGAGGARLFKGKSASVGDRISIQVGAGGAGGAGASSQGGTTGTSGGTGGSTTFAGTDTAPGGLGGGGGSSDIGGTGGANGGGPSSGFWSMASFQRVTGGRQNNGNAGAGSAFENYPDLSDASSSRPADYRGGSLVLPRTSLDGYGGGGGANQTSTPGRTDGPAGGSVLSAATSGAANTGSGSGGGRGCSSSQSTCENRNGAAGAAGYVLVYTTPIAYNDATGQSRYNVGESPTFPVFSTSGTIGSVTWQVSPALPGGISLNASTGVLSGTFTTAQMTKQYIFTATDSIGQIRQPAGWYVGIYKGPATAPTFNSANIVYNVPTALVASGGSGTGSLSFSSTDPNCVLSGTRGETVTAQKASGTCSITVTKAGDDNWFSASKSATFTMVKELSTISIAVSPASPRLEGTQITITATVGSGQTGTVTFSAGGSAIGSCGSSGVVTISGTSATCIWTPSSSGSPFTLSAAYSGDSNYQSSTSNSINYTIYPSISLSYPSISTTFGTAKTSTPTISGGTGSSSSWSWAVVKASDSSTVSGITINSSGVVSVASNVSAATYAMRVNTTDTVGITKSVLLTIVVGVSGGASTTVSADKSATTVGATVNLRATVVSAATGSIAFKYGSTTISGCGTVAISSGVATCAWTPASASGSPFTVTAVYSGDSNFSTNTSAGQTITVNAVGSFTYTAQNYDFGSERTISVSTSGGTGSFSTWTVINNSDSQSDYRVTINDVGRIAIANTLPVGTYTFTISATDEEGISGSGAIAITVTKSTPTVTLSAKMINGVAVTSGTLGKQVRLVVNLSTPAGGQATISGNSSTICTVFISNGAGECWWSPSDASGSPFTVSASYAGTTDANSGNSNQITNFVWNPTLSLSYSNRSVEVGKTATISPTIVGGTGTRTSWNWSIYRAITFDSIGGISVSNSGVISIGASVQPDTYTMTIGAIDLADATEYANVTIVIGDQVAPEISLSSSSETATVSSALTGFTITNGGSDVGAYSIEGSLPAGLSFNTGTGLISGTPTETLTVTTFVISASNYAGLDTATFTLTVNASGGGGGGGGGATITISLAGGVITAAKGTPIAVTASVNVTGRVSFYINGKPIGGCASRHTTSSVSCTWKPTTQGQSVTLSALLRPSSSNYTNARSNLLQVGVGRRTGRR